jgi:pimeloyl-ACP methyl ester carboxylesterase
VKTRIRRRRRRIVLGIVAALGLGLALGRSHVRTLLYTLYYLDGFAHIESGPRLTGVLAYEVTRRSELVPGPGGAPMRLDVYAPRAAGVWPALLVVPGFTKLGLEDPRMMGLARLVAGSGVLVAMPAMGGLFHYRWDLDVTERIATAFDAMAARPDVRAERLGIFGVSISGGLALAAATRPEVASRLHYAIAFAPYHDYRQMYRFILSGRYRFEGRTLQRKPSPFSRWIMLYNYLHLALDPADPDFAAMTEVIRLRIHESWPEADALAERLSPSGAKLLEQLEGDDQSVLGPLAERVIDWNRSEASLHSPNLGLCKLRGRLFVLHGRDDDVIPVSESLDLAEHCRDCPDLRCDVLLTGLYSHADMDAPFLGLWGRLRHQVPETARYCAFLYRVLRTMLD